MGATRTKDEEGKDVGPCPRVDYVGDTRDTKAKDESLALFNYGKGNISINFSRIFPYTLGRKISTHASWDPSTVHSLSTEKAFFYDLSLF